VVVVAVVSIGWVVRVAAVTTMVGSFVVVVDDGGGVASAGDCGVGTRVGVVLAVASLVGPAGFAVADDLSAVAGVAPVAGVALDAVVGAVAAWMTWSPALGNRSATDVAMTAAYLFARHGSLFFMLTCFRGDAAGQGRDFYPRPRDAGIKKPSFRSERRRRQAGPVEGAEETPLPSCPWRDSCPGHTVRDLMSARKQVF
jgi:hypothetical protein